MTLAVLAAAAALCAPAAWETRPEPMTASASIVVRVHAPADVAFPLFDPVNETKWDPDWKPRLLGPRVEEGLVFLVGDGDDKSTWLIDRYEPAARSIGYVAVTASLVTRIHIVVVPDGARSVATVTYARTALDGHGAKAVEHLAAHFGAQGPHWEAAINGYLDAAKPGS